ATAPHAIYTLSLHDALPISRPPIYVTLATPFQSNKPDVNKNWGLSLIVRKEETMARYLLIFTLSLIAILSFACANPAANKPKASVTNAAPETNAAKPAGAETRSEEHTSEL